MASGTFSLGQDGAKGKIILLVAVVAIVVIAAILVSVLAFKSSEEPDGCGSPKLDPNGLSNYSAGADTVAIGCFPGFFLDQMTVDKSGLVISKCIENRWLPEPPECNYLPLRLDCVVQRNGLTGFITMIQLGKANETKIVGLVKYQEAINPKGEGHLNEIVEISRHAPNCEINPNLNISKEIDEIGHMPDQYYLKVKFDSGKLAAYRPAAVHLNMIFLDVNTSVNLISVHQGNFKMVMPTKLPSFDDSPTKRTALHEFEKLQEFQLEANLV